MIFEIMQYFKKLLSKLVTMAHSTKDLPQIFQRIIQSKGNYLRQ